MRLNLKTTAVSTALILIAVAMALSLTACAKTSSSLGNNANSSLHHQSEAKADPQVIKNLDLNSLKAAAGDSLFSTPETQHKNIIQAIQNATATVDIVNYHLSDSGDIAAIKTAAARGVKFRILLDQDVLSKNNTALGIFNDLIQVGGVQVKKSSTGFSITHQKSLLVDFGKPSQLALITTMNLTTLSAQTRDFGLQTSDANIIKEMSLVFENDWYVNAANNTNQTPSLSEQRLVWSPVNSHDKIIGFIQSAKTSIDLEVENFGDSGVIAALVNQAKAGIKVQTISPACVTGATVANPLPNQNSITQLIAAGVNSRVSSPDVDAAHPYMHAKMILIDGQSFYLGSENFSMNSLMKARELGILTTDQAMADQLVKLFNADMDASQEPQTVTADICAKARGPYSAVTDETMDPQSDKVVIPPQTRVPVVPRPFHPPPVAPKPIPKP